MTSALPDQGAVIVTGASRGIGAAIAERLATDGYGVIVNYAADAEGAESVVSAVALSPMGRIGRPEEIAAAVSWLISPEASFVTGGDFAVTGGF